MRQLVVTEFITLDGVVEAPGGEPTHPHGGWTMPYGSEEMFAYKFEELMAAESLLLGRKTYEQWAHVWPQREAVDGEFAIKFNRMPKHVATRSLTRFEWNAVGLHGEVKDAVPAVKGGDGGPILVGGSATLVQSLLSLGLVDELTLLTFPVSVGGGLSIWPEDRSLQKFDLAETKPFAKGVVLYRYLRA